MYFDTHIDTPFEVIEILKATIRQPNHTAILNRTLNPAKWITCPAEQLKNECIDYLALAKLNKKQKKELRELLMTSKDRLIEKLKL